MRDMDQIALVVLTIILWTDFKWSVHTMYWWWLEFTGRAMTLDVGGYSIRIRVSDDTKLYDVRTQLKDSLTPKEKE